MAKALQCPACGHKHRLDALAGTPTFQCMACGRTLKTPAAFVRVTTPDAPEASRTARRRVVPPEPAAAVVESGANRTAVLTSPASAGAPTVMPPTPSGEVASARRDRRKAGPSGARWLVLRLVAWSVAIGLGGALVYLAGFLLGVVHKRDIQDLWLAVHGYGRYAKVLVLVPIWALVSAVLATVFIEGARKLLVRRAIGS